MVNILDVYGVHTITLNRMKQTPYGAVAADPETIPGCFVTETSRLVRDHTGAEVVSTAQVAVPHGTLTTLTSSPTVTLPSGKTGRIISISQGDNGGLPLPSFDTWSIE